MCVCTCVYVCVHVCMCVYVCVKCYLNLHYLQRDQFILQSRTSDDHVQAQPQPSSKQLLHIL